jgi:hypothetical protein
MNANTDSAGSQHAAPLHALRRAAAGAAALGVAGGLAGILFDPTQFFRSYLMAFVYWAGIALGCLGILMVYHLTAGGWGVAVRRLLEAAVATLPALAVLFVPLLFGLHSIYEWTHTEEVMADHVLSQKVAYLNVPFFIGRSVAIFLVWLTLAHFLDRWSRLQDETARPLVEDRLRKLSGGGLVIYALAMTVAAFDWIMSLEPHWFSTIFGMIFIADSAVGSMAFVLVATYVLSRDGGPLSRVTAPSILNDLGNLLLAFVMVYAYVSFSQLLIIWSANLPEEVPWYLHRIQGGWNLLAIALALFYFAVPFLVLLARRNKRQPQRLAVIAGGVLLARLLSVLFLTAPSFRSALAVTWIDVALWLGIGGVWVLLFTWRLASRPLLAIGDPELESALARQH